MTEREEIFINAGLSKNEAKVLNYFFEEDKHFSRQIERGADMRQPEVCTILGDFVERGWLIYKKIMRKEKGRPQQLYSFDSSKKEIITELVSDLRKEQEKIGETITNLESLQETIE